MIHAVLSGGALWLAALLRASWQGGLVIVLVWLACRAWPAMPAPARCWLWRLAYLKLLLGLLWLPPVPLPLLQTPPAAVSLPLPSVAPRPGLAAKTVVCLPPPSAPLPPPSPAPAQPESVPRDAITGLLLILWLAGVLSGLGQLVVACRRVSRLRRGSRQLIDAALLDAYAALGGRFGARRLPPLCVSAETSSPLLLGGVRPVILLPAFVTSECPPEAARLMLAHELAHLTRRDLLWNWLPLLAQRLFWFHPLVWLARREWALAQEIACDALAVEVAGASLTAYGRMVLDIATRGHGPRNPLTATVAGAESARTLRLRLFALLNVGTVNRRHPVTPGLLVILFLGLVPWRLVARPAAVPAVPPRPLTALIPQALPIPSVPVRKEPLMKHPIPAHVLKLSALLALPAGIHAAVAQTDPVPPAAPAASAPASPSAPTPEPPSAAKASRPAPAQTTPPTAPGAVTVAAVPGVPVVVRPAAPKNALTTPEKPTDTVVPVASDEGGVAQAERGLDRVNALYRAGAASAYQVAQAQAALADAHAADAADKRQWDVVTRDLSDAQTQQQKSLDIVTRQYQNGVASADDLSAAQARVGQARVRADLYALVTIREQALARVQARYQQGAASAQEVDRAAADLQQALSRFSAEPTVSPEPSASPEAPAHFPGLGTSSPVP